MDPIERRVRIFFGLNSANQPIYIPVVHELVLLLVYAAPCFKTPKHLQRGQKDTRWVYSVQTRRDQAHHRKGLWAAADHMRAERVSDALQVALDTRRPIFRGRASGRL